MIDKTRSAQDDLAFLRAVAEDRGPLPAPIGEHFAVVGVLYGVNVIAVWAGLAGMIPWPDDDSLAGWLPATLLYLPYSLHFFIRTRSARPGPTLRALGFAWMSMAFMTAAIVASIIVAGVTAKVAYVALWPSIALALYGGSWSIVGLVRRNLGDLAVAFGCFITAVICAGLIERPEKFLVFGLAIIAFLGGQGVRFMLAAKARC